MADFIQANNQEQAQTQAQTTNLCVVGIIGSSIYDRSEFANTSNGFLYTTINYSNIPYFYDLLKGTKTTNEFKYLNILRYFTTPNSKIFFDFKCSGDCCSGAKFSNEELTKKTSQLIELLLKKGANVVVGDHSMGALFNNWIPAHMGCSSPIEIKPETTSGLFRMFGNKKDFIESVHPTLNQIGDMSDNEKIQIDFSNMSGTLVYSINKNCPIPVKVISQGYPLFNPSNRMGREILENNLVNPQNHEEEKNLEPVQCEFSLFSAKIIVSSTHWCNLTEVKSEINEDKLKSQYTSAFGQNECNRIEQELNVIKSKGDKQEFQRYCSARVRDISSGSQFDK